MAELLSGYWPLGESLVDQSANGNNGTATGTSVTKGFFRQARTFDGTSSDYISFGNSVEFQDKSTVSFWIKLDSLTTGENANKELWIIGKRAGTAAQGNWNIVYLSPNHGTYPNSFKLTFHDGTSWNSKISNTANLVAGRWYHLAFVVDVKSTGGGNNVYLNGQRLGLTVDQSTSNWSATTTGTATIIGYSSVLESSFDGTAQEFGIYERLFNSQEIADYYAWAVQQGRSRLAFQRPALSNSYTFNESLAISDVLDRQATYGRKLAESLSIADALRFESAFTRKLSESLSISDALRYDRGRKIVEALSISDALVRNLELSRKLAESVSISDTLSREAVYNRKLTESLSISDALRAGKVYSKSISESLSISDALRYDKGRKISESLSISDTLRVSKVLSRKLSESLSISDALAYDKTAAAYSHVYGDLDLYTEIFWLQDENTLTPYLFSNVYGDLNINKIVSFIPKTNLYTLPLQLNIWKRIQSDPLQLIVNLLDGDIVTSSVSGNLDLYLTALPPTVTQIGEGFQVFMVIDGVATDISDKVTALNVSYSADKYVGELNATFKDEKLYEILHIKRFFGQRIFVVYIDGQNVGEFFFESRSGDASFGASEVSVWGRTKNALLGTPYSGRLSKAWDTDEVTALDIVTEILQPFPDIVLQWNIMNYSILPGKVSSDGRSVVEVIASLAEPVGGRLTTNFAGDLIVEYKWKQVTA